MDPSSRQGLVPPHGGVLVDRRASGAQRQVALDRAEVLPQLTLQPWQISDLELIGTGVLSPLTGFQNEQDYRSVLREMRLANGLIWALPVVLPISWDEAEALGRHDEIALTEPCGRVLAVLGVTDRFIRDREAEAITCYQTTDAVHPGVARLLAQGELCLAGEIQLLNVPPQQFPDYHLSPDQTRGVFAQKGWRTVVGFQTRNPVHRAHEYICKCALEICDGLLLHPLVGETKADDIPAATRMAAYQAILEHYFPADRSLLSVFPAAMRYAGPREAVWHALCRKNYGCTHFIVGRDHAGVGSYYGTYDAQRIFDQFDPGELGITPLCFEHTFFCRTCGGMASAKTCPHDQTERVALSGTKVRELLVAAEVPPPEFTRPEVAGVLIDGLTARAPVSGD